MALFPSTQIYVSSTSVNLAGDEKKRPNYLKTIIASNLLTNTGQSIGESLLEAYKHGPGLRLKSFFRWATTPGNNHTLPDARLGGTYNPDPAALAAQIPRAVGESVLVQESSMGFAEAARWAEQWMMINHPALLGTAWTSDINDTTLDITIYFQDGSTAVFTPVDFNKSYDYVYAVYSLGTPVSGGTEWSTPRTFIYRMGSGNAVLDGMLIDGAFMTAEFFPFIPIRQNNFFVSDTYRPLLHAENKRAYRRAFGGKIEEVIKQLAANESLPDIDYAYVAFGILPNTKELSSLRYLYRFFRRLMDGAITTEGDYGNYTGTFDAYTANINTWNTWQERQLSTESGGLLENPDDPSPPIINPPLLPISKIRIRTTSIITNADLFTYNFDMEISWQSISESVGVGLAKPTAKRGDVWFEDQGTDTVAVPLINTLGAITGKPKTVGTQKLYWQVDDDNWKCLTLTGMTHKNYIYGGKFVETSLTQCLSDPDNSGFLVPLHYPTLQTMNLVDTTQMSTASAYLVINSYQVVHASAFGFFFTFATVVATIVATVVFPPTGGLLGAHLAVGTAIGLTGAMATFVGFVVNAIAAMILAKIIMIASVVVFGDKLGQIIGAVLGFVTTVVAASIGQGMNMSAIWSSLGSASNLLALTNAIGSGISGYVQSAINDLNKDMAEFNKTMDSRLAEVEALYAKNIGYDNSLFDPMGLTDTTVGNSFEPPAQFFSRTLLTGSEIAEISLKMVSDFTRLTLSTKLPQTT